MASYAFGFRARRESVFVALCLALVLAQAGVAYAGRGVWTTAGPEGGLTHALAIDRTNPGRMYTGSCAGRLFRSDDAGGNWTAHGFIGGSGCGSTVLIHPHDPQILYALGFGANLSRSSDGGATWSRIDADMFTVNALAIDPLSATLYAAEVRGVLKSIDGGDTWQPSDSGPNVRALAVDALRPTTLYASNPEGLLKSEDAGKSWKPAGLADPFITSIAVDPRNSATIYVATDDVGLIRSTDGGISWQKVGPEVLRAVRSFTLDPSDNSTLYAATDLGTFSRVYKSKDQGTTWTLIGSGLPSARVQNLRVDPSDPRRVYAATLGDGIFHSIDGGLSFKTSNRGFVGTSVRGLAVDASGSEAALYAGTAGTGFFRSTDGGATWIASNAGMPSGTDSFNWVANDPSVPTTLLAAAGVDLLKSKAGESWQLLHRISGTAAIRRIVFDPVRQGTVYMFARRLQKSTDGGATWADAGLPVADGDIMDVAADPAAPDTVYAATVAGVYKSLDGGATWSPASSGLPTLTVREVLVDPRSPHTVYALTILGLARSLDGAASWTPMPGSVPGGFINTLSLDPAAPANLYAGTPVGVFKSMNAGGSWSPLNAGLDRTLIRRVVVNPREPGILYAATEGAGVQSLEQLEPGATDPGAGVVVQPVDSNPTPPTNNPTPVTVTFGEVTSGGTTSVATSGTGAPPPSGLKLGNPPVYFEISTTAGFTGPVTVCINYSGIAFGNEAKLKLHHNENGQWVDVTTSLDTANDIICGAVSSLSPFAVFEPEPYAFEGFLAPVSNLPAVNSVRAGSTLPVKFSLSGDKGLAILKPGYPVSRSVACTGGEPGQTLEEADAAGQSGLRYDAASDQYLYAWKTDPAWKGTCRRFELGLDDDSAHAIVVQFPSR